MKKQLKLSVHDLVDFLLRAGDIDERVYNQETMNEGSRLHALYQTSQGKDYQKEYSLKHSFNVRGYEVLLHGRADGLIDHGGDALTIDEIKSTNIDLSEYQNSQLEWHLGQAKCYALMAAYELKKSQAFVQLTYISQINNDRQVYKQSYTLDQLEADVLKLINEYIDFYEVITKHQESRKSSAKRLSFPFPKLRMGQNPMMIRVEEVVRDGGDLMIEAPTGIGKTMSTLFPSVKSFENEATNKIFYLTAKTSGQMMAYDTLQILKTKGLEINEVVISAKDKICLNLDNIKACNPDSCPFAKDYYTKIKDVLFEMFQNETSFSKETVLKYARKYMVCPFELQLDLSLFSDVIIGDYNYFFDPQVYLKRHFESESKDSVVLVDEAHNLVDRSQNMYSASINTFDFNKLEKKFKDLKDIPKFKTRIKALKREFDKIEPNLELFHEVVFKNLNETLFNELEKFILEAKKMLKDHPEYGFKDEFYPFFFSLNRFLKIYELFGDNYCGFFLKEHRGSFRLNLLCLDASNFLRERYRLVKSVVLFSATLTPSDYYQRVLGISHPLNNLILPSPFNNKHLLTLINPNISTKRDDRANSYESVAKSINAFINEKQGNYFIFVPSYEYLSILPPLLDQRKANLFIQEKEMSEEARFEFLNNFPKNPKTTNIGLLVMGGVFSEGIDMVEDRLIGVVIVGVGMPQVNFERRVMQNYYTEQGLNGFTYALVIPGINKVRQAVGRLIRSEEDYGAALFIESRYLQNNYRKIFTGMLGNYDYVTDEEQISFLLSEFYQKHNK